MEINIIQKNIERFIDNLNIEMLENVTNYLHKCYEELNPCVLENDELRYIKNTLIDLETLVKEYRDLKI